MALETKAKAKKEMAVARSESEKAEGSKKCSHEREISVTVSPS